MKKNFNIRKATRDDLPSLVNLENECFTHDKMSRTSYRLLLKKNSADILVAEMDNIIIGSATIFYRKNSKNARIYSIAVHPEYRQHGIAATLHAAIEKNALARQCNGIILEVRLDNMAAIQFYKKQAYEIFGKYTSFYEDGTDALRMKKNLIR